LAWLWNARCGVMRDGWRDVIRFDGVHKTYKLKSGRRTVLDNVSVTIPAGARMGILGINGAGKSTLLRLIAGSEEPDRGHIIKTGRVSFPVGFTGTFHPHYSARENLRFLAYIYDMNVAEVIDWVEDFCELGHYFDMPVATYSSGMFARIAFGTSFAFDFDVYLVDEAIEVGDARFRAKCAMAFAERVKTASLILVSQIVHTIRQYCDSAAILHEGKLTLYSTIDEAMDAYERFLRLYHV
jgi:capsular polysaccharide transport system ATP-binding protein